MAHLPNRIEIEFDKVLQKYSDHTYQHTAILTHGGTVVAFAMDDTSRIYYAVLDLKVDDEQRGEFDASFWLDDPVEVPFTNEISKVGYSITGSTVLPSVQKISHVEQNPGEIEEDDMDGFLSSTARLSALAPFHVYSDGSKIFIFRQTVSSTHERNLFLLKDGGSSGDNTRPQSDFVTFGGQKISVVNNTLLCDVFILAGTELKKSREVRYQRSRHKTMPASNTDALAAMDMEGKPFFMPTQHMAFVRDLQGQAFSVIQLPTVISGMSRWQIFTQQAMSKRLDFYNVEVSKEGLFNLQGSQLYTSPDATYQSSVLERAPGKCPFTNAPLIPVVSKSGHAETCLHISSNGDVATGTMSSWTSGKFTVEAWIKKDAQVTAPTGTGIFLSHTESIAGTFHIDIGSNEFVRFSSPSAPTNTMPAFKLSSAWTHIAITYDGEAVRGYENGIEKASKNISGMSVLFNQLRIGSNRAADKSFRGKIDEVRVWDRARSGAELKSQMNVRLNGWELGLMSYWRFDESSGLVAHDQGQKEVTLSLQGSATFRPSDCPIGSTSSMRRSSIQFNGRTITGGISCSLYYQQENVMTGYSNTSKPMKKQARVMALIGTQDTGGTAALVCLDIGISKEGRLAQCPDALSIPDLAEPEYVTVIRQTRNAYEEFRNNQDNLTKYNAFYLLNQKLQALSTYDGVQSTIPLKGLHYDPSGLTICGGVMRFAESDGGCHLMPSATGDLNLYFRNTYDGRFHTAHFDSNVQRVRFNLTPHLCLESRTGGTYAVDSVRVNPGATADTCTLVLTENDHNIVETWSNLPRNPAQAVELLNGTAERPSSLTVNNTWNSADTSRKSYLVNAALLDDTSTATVQDGVKSAIPGKDSSWKSKEPGAKYDLKWDVNQLSLPAAKVSQTATHASLTIEMWVTKSNANFNYGSIAHHVSSKCGYTFGVLRKSLPGETSSQNYFIVAGKSEGSANNHAGEQFLVSKDRIDFTQWHHLVMQFSQSYAIQFSGSQYIDCGKSTVLNITKDLTIEIYVKLNQSGSHGLIGKGIIEQEGVPYQILVTPAGNIQFVFEDEHGVKQTFTSTRTLVVGKFHRIAITRKLGKNKEEKTGSKNVSYNVPDGSGGQTAQNLALNIVTEVEMNDFCDIKFYIDKAEAGVCRFDGASPLGHKDALEIGRCRTSPSEEMYTNGVISEARIWNRALEKNEVSREVKGQESGLVAWWTFEEAKGNVAADFKGLGNGKLNGPQWVKSPDCDANIFRLYRNGKRMLTEPLLQSNALWTPHWSNRWGDSGFYIGSSKSSGTLANRFCGQLDELRFWKTIRTQEQIMDNMFTTLKGEKRDLLAYYTFDGESAANSTHLYDMGLLGNDFLLPTTDKVTIDVSTAPVGEDAPVIFSSLLGTQTHLQTEIDSIPRVCEYADMQRDSKGNLGGVLKRCYSYVKDNQWHLITGFKVGNLISEWIGQAQFDPQVVGYVEGAPPVPSENLVMGLVESADGAGMVEVVESSEVTYTVGVAKEGSSDASFKAGAAISAGSDDLLIIAPLGFGYGKALTDIAVDIGLQGSFDVTQGWSQEESQGRTLNRTRSMAVTTGGGFEGEDATNQLNPSIGRRALPGNAGIALVQSSTADIYALRLAHNNALVSLRMLPNPDIPQDWNIIPFPINPRYTKQGTLDGRIGYDSGGAVVLDPDYTGSTGYGEYSYYKPREAYRTEERIRRDEQRMLSYYQQFDTGFGSTMGSVVGSAAGAAAGLMIPGAGPVIAAASLGAGISTIKKTFNDSDVAKQSAKRDMVNTYVWTADGGFFAETTETTESRTEVTSGNFGFQGAFGASVSANVDIFSFGVNFEFEAALGGGMSVTKTKTSESEQSFSMNVEVDVPGILQKHQMNQYGKWVGVFTDEGDPVVPAGKVDAYRFKTFYLDCSSDNFDDLFMKVVDPIWLATSNQPNAMALRQANQSTKKPPCWRVFHRVTFVSRILPDISQTAPQSMEGSMKAANVDSNWQLIQMIEPFVLSKKHDFRLFSAAVRETLAKYLPQLSSHSAKIIEYLATYYGLALDE